MLLQPMLQRLAAARGLREILGVALHDVIALLGAERGDVQFVGTDGALVLVAQHNLPEGFLRALARVEPDAGTVCARARAAREVVFVRDVGRDPPFAPYAALAKAVPFTSVLSLPLLAAPQRCIGMLSVLSASFEPTPLELESIRRYAGELVQAILRVAGEGELPALADSLCRQVLADATRRSRLA
jgi:GAF domain-containing protein